MPTANASTTTDPRETPGSGTSSSLAEPATPDTTVTACVTTSVRHSRGSCPGGCRRQPSVGSGSLQDGAHGPTRSWRAAPAVVPAGPSPSTRSFMTGATVRPFHTCSHHPGRVNPDPGARRPYQWPDRAILKVATARATSSVITPKTADLL